MSHIRKKAKLSHEGAGGLQTQQGIPPAASSASITLGGSSATGSTHIQQGQSRESLPSSSPINPQQPPAARSLWDRAYDALAKENSDLVKRYDELLAKEQLASSVPNETTPLQLPAPHSLDTLPGHSSRQIQLNTVIQTGLQRMEDNKATYKIGRHEIFLPDKITQVSNLLLWVKDWIGSAVKDSPEASLAWSAVCLILPLFTNPTTAAEANRDGFVYVTSRMRYYVALEPLLRRLGQNARVDEAVLSAANDHIVDLYQAILEFQLRSVLRFYQGRLKTYVRDIVPSRDWKQTLLDIQTLEGTVNGDLRQINALAARQELEILNKTSEETRATMENCLSVATQQLTVQMEQLAVHQAALVAAEQEKLRIKKQEQEERQRKCLQLFYLTQNGSGATYDWYKSRVELRVEGTCRWFLQHKNFQQWLSQESGPLLVSADPGCGKSVLAKYLIDHELAQQSATICYFFFKDQDQNTVRQALCALLHQLFSQNPTLIKRAMGLYDNKGENLVESEESLWTILRDAVCDPEAGPVIFVIDALDECDESQLRSLVTNLKDIFDDQQLENAKFKVLMTSRPYEQVVSEFYSLQDVFHRIHIPGEEEFEAISQEINCVIKHRVNQLARKHRLPDNIKSSLDRKLLAIEHRTYLWVYLVFDYLEKGFKKTDDGIDAAIQTLPKTVNQAYDQILNRAQDDGTVKTVKKVLSIILAARRPFTLSEMNIAMSLDGHGRGRGRSIYDLDLEQDVDFKTRLRTLCGLFVNVHHDKVYFLHQTAREFLLQSSAPTTVLSNFQWHRSITTRYAHSVLAEICLLYLDRLNSTHTETFHEHGHHGALLEYSLEYWDDHCREAEFETASAMVDLASKLCTPDLTSHPRWASIISERFDICPGSSTHVLVASRLGLTPVTELLLSRGADIEARDDNGWIALIFAAEYGYEAVARVLLENGAHVEAKIYDGCTALMIAAKSGHQAVTRLLLENGADVEAINNIGLTALMHAAQSGHQAVTRLLLENGADVETKNNDGWTALMLATGSGHDAVIRLLLGADVEAKSNNGWTALLLAARSGQGAVTQLLLENGADIEARDKNNKTALMLAARYGHRVVTRLLLQNGAAVEACNKYGRTALLDAAGSGHEAVTRLLLQNGADIEARNVMGRTALIYAIKSRHEAVTRLLIENGANVEAKDIRGWTALICAVRSGNEAVTRLLIENGADTEARTADGWSALMVAARFDREAVTRLLLENGADIEAKDANGWTALMLAARYGYEAVTRLLLENGADVEARADDGRTALMLAARFGREAIRRLLIDNGAKVEAEENGGYSL